VDTAFVLPKDEEDIHQAGKATHKRDLADAANQGVTDEQHVFEQLGFLP